MPDALAKAENQKFCAECANPILKIADFCPKCGVRQPGMAAAVAAPVAQRSRGVALLLCFFLGGIGAHAFYLGKVGSGIARLLFFWTLIPAFIALVEFFMLLSMSEAKFQAKYAGG